MEEQEKNITTAENEQFLDAFVGLYQELKEEAGKSAKTSENVKRFLKDKQSLYEKASRNRVTVKDFKKETLLGQGGYGTVHLVTREGDDGVYAMKAIKKSSITDDSAGYMQERDILEFGRSCDWVIKLHYSFQDDRCLYFVMDFMAGGDLVRLLEQFEFSEMHVQFYAAECINGINAIHKFGYIHRDIKPDNVLLDNKGHVKIGDFGTCIQMIKNDDGVQTNKCKFATGPGTMDYVSPEVLENATKRQMSVYGPEIDWWSFGIMIYELFYYETPFYDDSQMMQQAAIINFEDKFNFPVDDEIKVTDTAKAFIKCFIARRTKRVGRSGPDDISDITGHKFFKGVDWNFDTIRNYDPPFPVELKSPKDTSNFDAEETAKSNDLVDTSNFRTQNRENNGFQGKQLPFIGFSFNTIPESSNSTSSQPIQNNNQSSAENAKQTAKIQQLQEDLASKQLELAKLDSSMKNMQNDLNEQNQEVEKNQLSLSNKIEELKKAKHSYHKKCDELTTLQQNNDDNRTEKMRLKLEVTQLQQSYDSTTELQSQEHQKITSLQKQLLDAQLKVDVKQDEIIKLKQHEDELLADQYNKEAHIKKLVEDKLELENNRKFLSTEVKATHNQLNTELVENSRLKQEISVKSAEIDQMDREKEKMCKDLEMEKIMKHQVVMKLGTTKAELTVLQRNETRGITGKLGRAFGRVKQGGDNEKKIRHLEKQMKTMRSDNSRMKQDSEIVRADYEDKIYSKNGEIDEWKLKYEELLHKSSQGEGPRASQRSSFTAWLGVQSTAVSKKGEENTIDADDSIVKRRQTKRIRPELKFQTVFGEINLDDKIFRLYDDDRRTRIVSHFPLDEVKRARPINDVDIHSFKHKESSNIESIYQLVVLTKDRADTIFFRANNPGEQKIWLNRFNSLI